MQENEKEGIVGEALEQRRHHISYRQQCTERKNDATKFKEILLLIEY